MPIHEHDPWREQYFVGVDCPPEVVIPTDDEDAHALFPAQRWIYDRRTIARSQGLACGLHDEPPGRYPVFCKPCVNLKGMGIGTSVLRNAADFHERCVPGRFWMQLLRGTHVSSDIAVMAGRAVWFRHTQGIPAAAGTFDHWIVAAARKPALERYLRRWIHGQLSDYTGMINVETIGGRIIEMHLRFADQWPDLYGDGWLQAVVRLYHRGEWRFDDGQRLDGYSVVLFGPHRQAYRYPDADRLAGYRASAGISSVQITFDGARPAAAHAMPPGGFRLAVINTQDFAAGVRLRELIARDFDVPLPPRLRSARPPHAARQLEWIQSPS